MSRRTHITKYLIYTQEEYRIICLTCLNLMPSPPKYQDLWEPCQIKTRKRNISWNAKIYESYNLG